MENIDRIGQLTNELQKNYFALAVQLISEALNKKLTQQVVINMRDGNITDIRRNDIISGATIVDMFIGSV